MTPAMRRTLAVMLADPDVPWTADRLAAALRVKPRKVHATLMRLERAGHVDSGWALPVDRRRARREYWLTDVGKGWSCSPVELCPARSGRSWLARARALVCVLVASWVASWAAFFVLPPPVALAVLIVGAFIVGFALGDVDWLQ